ncbi:MAG: endonuclease/exonuclease/phosphatase family protein [Bacteroidales bacterium]|nr:endonuclease/exonuclease/phosphatase family protein [Bacteroidales bacterium]
MRRPRLRIAGFIYILLTIPYLLAVMAQWVSPGIMWLLALFGLVFPVLLAIQVLYGLYFLYKLRWLVILPVLVIGLTTKPITNSIQWFSKPKNQVVNEGIEIMTYNVRLLDFFGWSKIPDSGEHMLQTIRNEQPDVLCMQEFMVQTEGRYTLDKIRSDLDFLPEYHIIYNYHSYKRNHGMAIFTRYPILSSGEIRFNNSTNLFIFSDLLIDGDTIRIYNVHLQSFHVEAEEELQGLNNQKVRRLIAKTRMAYKMRAEQARILSAHLQTSPYPVVVCGDFNDTPVSYATHLIRKNLHDSFIDSGKGFSSTYQYIPWLRIDYILPDHSFVSSGYRTGSLNGSDHRPVIVNIKKAISPDPHSLR